MFERAIEEKLGGHPKCSHCKEKSALMLFSRKEMTIGCYTCPSGYVSRIVTYGKELDLIGFKSLLSSWVQGVTDLKDEDVRVATRYTWDLGIEGGQPGMVLREAYWTQGYRRTRSNDPNRIALFVCGKCGAFYNKALSDVNRLCPQCRGPPS